MALKLTEYPDEVTARAAERDAIVAEHPHHNIAHRAVA